MSAVSRVKTSNLAMAIPVAVGAAVAGGLIGFFLFGRLVGFGPDLTAFLSGAVTGGLMAVFLQGDSSDDGRSAVAV